jgi:hypothetical protein
MRRADDSRRTPTSSAQPANSEPDRGEITDVSGYVSPKLVDLGSVRSVVLGSAGGGRSDQNGQYYY